MYWPLLILLLLAIPANAQGNTTVTCPTSITFDNQGRIITAVSGKCVQAGLMLQAGGYVRLQKGGRLLCQGGC